MFRLSFNLVISLMCLVALNSNAQTNRRNTKKSVVYNANYQPIALGCMGNFSFEIREGTLWAWGDNYYGQLGDGTTEDRIIPVQIGTDTKWVNVTIGLQHTIALKSDGTIWAWGNNGWGQLGDGTRNPTKSPIQIGKDNTWISIATNDNHSLGLKSDGTIWGWGDNGFGQLGDSSYSSSFVPVKIGSSNEWVNIATGTYFSVGLKSNGSLWGWGDNSYGQLGDGTTKQRKSPKQIGSDKWTSIGPGGYHTLALKSDGTLWAWGYNGSGQLGDGTTKGRSIPAQIGSDENWTSIAPGRNYTLALKSDGTLWGCGNNYYGNLGNGANAHLLSLMQIGNDNNWVNVTTNYYHTFGLKSDGTLWGWGWNSQGEIGDSSKTDKNSPVQIRKDDKWLSVESGAFHSVGLRSNGTLWGWGLNSNGQLGDSSQMQRNSPKKIGTDNKWMSIIAGGYHSLGIKSDGTLWAWGFNSTGQLGDTSNTDKNTPVQVGSDNKWVSIAAGSYHSLGLKCDGTLWAWGLNLSGQLGIGSNTNKAIPVQIGTERKWVSIVAGNNHSIGLKSDGTLWAWGANDYYQLGDGSQVSKKSPTQIGTDNNWVSIAAGGYHTLALKSDGILWAWGDNYREQLGNETIGSEKKPIRIGKDNNWVTISGGTFHSFASKSDGSLYGWGDNASGQFADSTQKKKTGFIQIGKENNWITIAAGGYHCIGLSTERNLFWAMGNNCYGQLGDSNIVNCTPPAVPKASDKTICFETATTLTAMGEGRLGWYNAAKGGTYLGGGPNYLTSPLSVKTIFYVQDSTYTASETRKEVIVKINPLPLVSVKASDSVVCIGKKVILKGMGTKTFIWSGGIIDSIGFIPDSNSTYTVKGIDSNGCSNTAKIKIIVNSSPKVEVIASDTIVCKGNSITLAGVGAFSYLWSDGIKDNISFIPTGTNSYKVIGLDTNNCSDSVTLKIIVNSLPNVVANVSDTIMCKGLPVIFNGEGAYTYKWSGGVINGVAFVPLSSYAYTVTGTDTNNCSDEAIVKIIVNPLPKVEIESSDTILCKGDSVTLTCKGAIYYAWSSGIKNDIGFVPYFTSVYTLQGVDSNNCSDTATIRIKVNPLPEVKVLANDTVICKGGFIILTGTGANSYFWSNGIINGIGFIPDSTNSYIVQGIDTNNCSDSVKINVRVNSLPEIKASTNDSVVCKGDLIILKGSGANIYNWSNKVIDGVGFIPLVTSVYTVIGTDLNNCSDSTKIKVIVNPMPDMNIDFNNNLLTVGQTGGTRYQWIDCDIRKSPIPGATRRTYYPIKNGNYAVIVVLNNCFDTSDCINVNSVNGSNILFLIYPNPNTGTFEVNSGFEGNYKIINSIGKKIQTGSLFKGKNYNIQMPEESQGIYFIVGFNNNLIVSKKFIVLK